MDQEEQAIRQAVAAISQSDPLTKLLQQVSFGRMKAGDPGLRAVIESWLSVYQKIIAAGSFSKRALRRLDPSPRVARMVEAGMLDEKHHGIAELSDTFERVFRQAPD